MKRTVFSLLAFFILITCMEAAPIDKEQARKKAEKFMAARGMTIKNVKLEMTAPRKTISKNNTESTYYVFNTDKGNGFVIISGDDRTHEVLGYSDKGNFTKEELPINVKAWLDEYAKQINSMDEHCEMPTKESVFCKAPEKRDAISPLLNTQWSQNTPFNNFCPEYDFGKKSLTGCVATALAQVMYYHRWPEGHINTDIPSYTTETKNIYMPTLPTTKFEWDKMPQNHTDEDKDSAVAKLMLYVGQAINMDYNYESSANFKNATFAAKEYFGYDQNTEYKYRSDYSLKEWHDIVYSELANARPVIYRGGSHGGGGHAFVCDGYDGNGLYHINWGWGGNYDGYFRLEVLNPSGSDIGNYSNTGGYSFDQKCIVGMTKPQGNTRNDQYLTAYNLRLSTDSITCSIYNQTTDDNIFDIGWGIQDEKGNISKVIKTTHRNRKLQVGYGYKKIYISVNDIKLDNGTYRIVPISKESNKSTWRSALPSLLKYAEVTIDHQFDMKTVVIHPKQEIKLSSIRYPEIIFQNKVTPITVHIANLEEEFNGKLYMYATTDSTNNWIQVAGGELYIEKGETDSILMYPQFKDSGKLYVAISMGDMHEYIKKDTIQVEPITLPINIDIEDIVSEQNDASVIYTIKIKNNSKEHFADRININNYTRDGNYTGSVPSYEYKNFNITIKPNETYTLQHIIENVEPYMYYSIGVRAYDSLYNTWGNTVFSKWIKVTPSGINGVLMDDVTLSTGKNSLHYTINGIKVGKPTKKGIYIHKGKKTIISGQ